jgi:hypothetical protein
MLASLLLGDTATSAGIATIVATAITSFTGYAIARSARVAQERGAETTTRTDIEKAAFERAESYYIKAMGRQDDTIAQQGLTIARQGEKIERQEREIEEQERKLEQCQKREERLQEEVERLSRRVGELDRKLGTAEEELARVRRGGGE